jgi:hypothetical protein
MTKINGTKRAHMFHDNVFRVIGRTHMFFDNVFLGTGSVHMLLDNVFVIRIASCHYTLHDFPRDFYQE